MSVTTELPYETADTEERCITMALLELLDIDRFVRTDEDPLAAVCRIVAQNLPQVKFAIYCRRDDFIWRNSYVEDGFRVGPTPPLVEKLFLKYMWDGMGDGDVFGVEHGEDLPFVRKSDVAKWKCRSCAAISVRNGLEREGLVVLFFLGNRKLDRRYLTWLKILSDAVSMINRNQFLERRVRELGTTCEKRQQEYRQSLSSLRSWLGDAEFLKWVRRADRTPKIKAFVGVRGGMKSRMLVGIRHWLLARGVPEERIISIDLESADFRNFKTAEDMQRYLGRFPHCKGCRYLLLDEIGNIIWHADLLRALYRSREWNVWFAASTSNVFDDMRQDELANVFEMYYVWANPMVPRTDEELRRNWGWMFMRDAVNGLYHADIRALETLAEYFSDHLGEARSLREITAGLAELGHKLAPNTITAYRKALESAFLIETSEVYDTLERHVKRLPGRVFWTDLELRKWRFGPAAEHELERLQENRLYLELRRRYDKVYTSYDGRSEFVTLGKDGSVMAWNIGDKVR